MLRGDVRWIDSGIAVPGETKGRRPAVIVSNDGANASASRSRRGVITVLPLTTNIRTLHRFQVLLNSEECGIPENSKVQVEQIRSVAVTRVGSRIGTVPPRLMSEIDEAMRVHLSM